MNPLELLKQFLGSSYTHSFRKPGYEQNGQPQQAQPPVQLAQAAQTPMPTASPQRGGVTLEEAIRQVLAARAAPMVKDAGLLAQAGRQFEAAGLDPLMPTILAIRETQGGKDLEKRDWGKNNPYNIRGEQGGKKQFISYPDLQTATFGGRNEYAPGQYVDAQGLSGLILQNKIYEDFRKSKSLADFFNHYSPSVDNNGPLTGQDIKDPVTGKGDQIYNYNYIRGQFPQYQ